MDSNAFQKIKMTVLRASGGTGALAEALGISSHAISQWSRVPAERVGQVARITGLSPDQIRPDIFVEIPDTSSA